MHAYTWDIDGTRTIHDDRYALHTTLAAGDTHIESSLVEQARCLTKSIKAMIQRDREKLCLFSLRLSETWRMIWLRWSPWTDIRCLLMSCFYSISSIFKVKIWFQVSATVGLRCLSHLCLGAFRINVRKRRNPIVKDTVTVRATTMMSVALVKRSTPMMKRVRLQRITTIHLCKRHPR